MGFIACSRSTQQGLFVKDNRRWHWKRRCHYHNDRHVLLLQHHYRSHHGNGHNGVLPTCSASPVGVIRQQIFQGGRKEVYTLEHNCAHPSQNYQDARWRMIFKIISLKDGFFDY
jgi:hypothetical protein